jgi:transcription-repair coupling factor (superfamily II helicase)
MSRPRFLLPDHTGELAAGTQLSWGQAYGCATPLVIAEYWQKYRAPVLAIAPGVAAAESLEAQLKFFCPAEARIALLPDLETLPYDSFSPHADLTARRLAVLAGLLAERIDICVVAMPTLSFRLPPRDYIARHSLQLHAGQQLEREDLQTQLERNAYQRVSQVSEHGEYAVRG